MPRGKPEDWARHLQSIDTVPGYLCPDCGQATKNRRLLHIDTCPLAREMDATSDADREFFAQHPFTEEYYRPITRSEIESMRAVGQIPLEYVRAEGQVRVQNVPQAHARFRHYDDVLFYLDSRR